MSKTSLNKITSAHVKSNGKEVATNFTEKKHFFIQAIDAHWHTALITIEGQGREEDNSSKDEEISEENRSVCISFAKNSFRVEVR